MSTTSNIKKRIVLIGHDNYGSREFVECFARTFPNCDFELYITTGIYYRKTFFQSIFKLLKEASLVFCFYRFINMLLFKLRGRGLQKTARQLGIPYFFTSDINNEESQQKIRAYSPDLVVVLFTMHIIQEAIIRIPKIAAIGSHPSILPEYRGLEVFFWALAHNEKTSGVSVFYLDPKIDNGEVINQRVFDIDADETVESIYHKLTEITKRLLIETVITLSEDKTPITYPKVGQGAYFPMPTPECYRTFKRSGRKLFRWRELLQNT